MHLHKTSTNPIICWGLETLFGKVTIQKRLSYLKVLMAQCEGDEKERLNPEEPIGRLKINRLLPKIALLEHVLMDILVPNRFINIQMHAGFGICDHSHYLLILHSFSSLSS